MVLVLGLAMAGAGLMGGGSVFFAGGGRGCSGDGSPGSAKALTTAAQPAASAAGRATIPADYLHLYQQAGKKYGVPWVVLAGIGEGERNQGRPMLPGGHNGADAVGAPGPSPSGIGGAAGGPPGAPPAPPAPR